MGVEGSRSHQAELPQHFLDAAVEIVVEIAGRETDHAVALRFQPCIAATIAQHLLRHGMVLAVYLDDERTGMNDESTT